MRRRHSPNWVFVYFFITSFALATQAYAPLVFYFGVDATATVTAATSTWTCLTEFKGEPCYSVAYAFVALDGHTINATADITEVEGVPFPPRRGQTLAVRYLPAWPDASTPTYYAVPGWRLRNVAFIGLFWVIATGGVLFSLLGGASSGPADQIPA